MTSSQANESNTMSDPNTTLDTAFAEGELEELTPIASGVMNPSDTTRLGPGSYVTVTGVPSTVPSATRASSSSAAVARENACLGRAGRPAVATLASAWAGLISRLKFPMF